MTAARGAGALGRRSAALLGAAETCSAPRPARAAGARCGPLAALGRGGGHAWGARGAIPAAAERRRLLAGGAGARVRRRAGRWSGRSRGVALGGRGPVARRRACCARDGERYRRAVDAGAAAAGAGARGRARRRSLAARRPRRGGARGWRARPGTSCGARAAELAARRADRRRARGHAQRACAPAHRHARGRLPASAPRGRRPRPAAARERRARSRTSRGSRARCGRRPPRRASPACSWCCCRSAARCWPSWPAPAGSRGLLELVPHRVARAASRSRCRSLAAVLIHRLARVR